jgi:aspartate racemase
VLTKSDLGVAPGEPRVGLVGGLGPESTIDYYRRIIAAWERDAPGSSPAIVIDSLDVQVGLRLVANDRPALTDYLLASLRRLAAAGASFVAITANTAHVVFDELAASSPVPLLGIVEPVAMAARARGLGNLALLGTRFTMEAGFYAAACARHGIAVVAPDEGERTWLHQRYVGELLAGKFSDETRAGVVGLVERMRERHGIDGVILAGTELPLLLQGDRVGGLPLLDSTGLHVDAIVGRLRV